MTEEQIKYMVDRFPETFNPDGGVHFEGIAGVSEMPIGTNVLSAIEATAMVRHMIEGMPSDKTPTPIQSEPYDWRKDPTKNAGNGY